MYDRESGAWERGRDEPANRELVERTADELAKVVVPPGPVADLGCGPGAHALALARRGYDVVGLDGSPRMVEVARTRSGRDKVDATFEVHDVSAPLRFADASLGGVLVILVLQHLAHPGAFIAEIRCCLRPGGHVLITAPARDSRPLPPGSRRRPLLRHQLAALFGRGPWSDCRRMPQRARPRERVGPRLRPRGRPPVGTGSHPTRGPSGSE